VRPSDELNVLERVQSAGCDGFLGFYSTVASSGLVNLLGNCHSIEVQFFDHEQIERHLLESSNGHRLAERFFPLSTAPAHRAAELYIDMPPILCENCGNDLIKTPNGIWVLWHTVTEEHRSNIDMHFACKGICDRKVTEVVRARHSAKGFIYDGWDDISDLLIPTVYLTKVMATVNGLAAGEAYEVDALEKFKWLLCATFPYVARNLTTGQQKDLRRLQRIPSWLGGMGYET
jgi:hypothetical protein